MRRARDGSRVLDELELEPRAAAWIGAVRLDGVPIALGSILASVAIRHGRDDVDGPTQSSTATLRLRNLSREELADWTVGAELELDDSLGARLFTGRTTDATLSDDDFSADSILEVIAVSTLARAGDRPVGGHQWPAETWSARVARILGEAGLTGVVQSPASPINLAATVPDDPGPPAVYSELSALDALEVVRQDVGAAIFDDVDGSIVVQAFDGRKSSAGVPLYPPLSLDPALVLFSPPWSMTLDVANRVVLGYGYGAGSVTVNEPASQARFGLHWTGLFESGLVDQATAQSRASLWVDRVAWPRWKLPGLTLLEPHSLHVGQLLELTELPASAPFASFAGVVEGWTDVIEGADWHQEVVLSDPIFSGLALAWNELPSTLHWQDVDPACSWSDAFLLDNLVP